MSGRKNQGSRFGKYLAFGSASGSKDPDSADPQSEQSSGHKSPQAALSPPTASRSSRLFNKLRGRSLSPSPSLGIERRNSSPDQPIATTSSQSLTIVRGRPRSSSSDSSALQKHGPSLHEISSSMPASIPIVHISHSQSESIASENPAVPSTCQVQALAKSDVHAAILPQTKSIDVIVPSSHSSVVWAKALEITKKKLCDNNLPPLDLTDLTLQSADENIQALVKALNNAQEDDKRKAWSYTWRGKEVMVMERLGKILKSMEKYSKVVDTAIQSNPQVSAVVWAGVWAIMQVRIDVLSLDQCLAYSLSRSR